MKILVIGDYISDVYTFGTATRLCPEAPVPVIVPSEEKETAGGAGLVTAQLQELRADVARLYGSKSVKHRYFVGGHLICRVDEDGSYVPEFVKQEIPRMLPLCDAIVVSDYGKGALTRELAKQIINTGKPCFIDSKHNLDWYRGPHSIAFPNEHEMFLEDWFIQIVRKLGANGCTLITPPHEPDFHIDATVSEVVDVTGAGDIFMASFVYAWSINLPAEDCLRFANEMAGESCRHRGTFVVGREFAQSVLDRLRVSAKSEPQTPDLATYSNSPEHTRAQQLYPSVSIPELLQSLGEPLREDLSPAPTEQGVILDTLATWQTPRQLPSDPTESSDARLPADQQIPDKSDMKPQMVEQAPNPISTSHQCGHTPARDQVLHPKKA